jgi:hypothetical protein
MRFVICAIALMLFIAARSCGGELDYDQIAAAAIKHADEAVKPRLKELLNLELKLTREALIDAKKLQVASKGSRKPVETTKETKEAIVEALESNLKRLKAKLDSIDSETIVILENVEGSRPKKGVVYVLKGDRHIRAINDKEAIVDFWHGLERPGPTFLLTGIDATEILRKQTRDGLKFTYDSPMYLFYSDEYSMPVVTGESRKIPSMSLIDGDKLRDAIALKNRELATAFPKQKLSPLNWENFSSAEPEVKAVPNKDGSVGGKYGGNPYGK